jgi:hypothetical protein
MTRKFRLGHVYRVECDDHCYHSGPVSESGLAQMVLWGPCLGVTENSVTILHCDSVHDGDVLRRDQHTIMLGTIRKVKHYGKA